MRRWVVACLALLATVLAASPAHAAERWLRAESPQFVVYGEDGEEKLVAAVRDLEALDGLLRRMTQVADQVGAPARPRHCQSKVRSPACHSF